MGLSEFEEAYDEEDEQRLGSALLGVPIQNLEPRAPVCVGPATSLAEAVERMNAVKAGCVLVTDGGALVGILTERDILRHVVGKLDLTTPVEQAMTRSPECVRPELSVAYALQKMHLGGYRHVPVVDDAGRPVGVLSIRDFMRFIVAQLPAAVLNLPPEPDLSLPRSAEGA